MSILSALLAAAETAEGPRGPPAVEVADAVGLGAAVAEAVPEAPAADEGGAKPPPGVVTVASSARLCCELLA